MAELPGELPGESGGGRGESPTEGVVGRLLMWWVDTVRQHARLVLWLTSIATLVLLGYALNNLGLNMSQTAILSD